MKKKIRYDETVTLPAGRTMPFAEAVAAAMAGVKRRSRVLLVDPDAWCGEVTVQPSRVRGVEGETLARLIGYETEPYSGLPPAKTAVACRRLAETAEGVVYRVVEMPYAEIAAAGKAVKEAGSSLVALAHPDLTEEPLEPPPAPRGVSFFVKSGLVAALAVAALVLAVYLPLDGRNRARSGELRELERLQRECRAVEARAQADRSAAEDYRRRIAEEIKKPLRKLRARRSFARILEALSSTCPEGGMIRELRSEGDYILAVEGITSTSADAEGFLKALGTNLRTGGFAVATLSLESMNQLPGGGPWSFRCRIAPVPGEVE